MTESVLGAIVLSAFVPRRSATAHRDTSLIQAYVVHWIALILGAIAVVAVLAQEDDIRSDLVDLLDQGDLFTATAAIVCVIVVVVTEALFALLALLLLPWGDGAAPVGPLWRQALRTAWLHTGHFGLAACLYTEIYVFCEMHLEPLQRYRWVHEPERQTGSALLQWVADHYQYALPVLFAGLVAWYLWALLRAMTTRLLPPAPARPPLCEACGYNLSHHDVSARCPECGRPVAMSVGPDVRRPVSWIPFGTGSPRTGVVRATIGAWLRPERFFMSVSVMQGVGSAGAFLLVHLILTAVAVPFGSAASFALFYRDELIDVLHDDALLEAACALSWFGTSIGCVCGLVVCVSATVIGLIFSRSDGRNQTAACLRVACFCTGIFPLCCFVLTVGTVVAVYVIEALGLLGHPYAIPLAIGVLGAITAVTVFYIGGVARRMQYVRYANS